MAKQLVNIGTSPNDGTGDPLRDAFDKINDNFNELYQGLGDGSSLGLALDSDGNIDASNNVTIAGDLTVSGTYFTVNTETVEFEDNILNLNRTQGTPDVATATTSGISIYRGDGITEASFIFDDADDTWDLTNSLVVANTLQATTLTDGTATLTGGVLSNVTFADGVTAVTQATSDNSTKIATTAYVKSVVTLEDLDFAGDSGTGSIDLDSQSLTISGTTNEIETSASGQTITIGLPNNVVITGDLTVDTNTLYVDSADNRVGIGTLNPVDTLEVSGGITVDSSTSTLTLKGSNTGASLINFADSDDGNVGRIYYDHTSNFMQFKANDAERMRITSGGDISFRDTSNNEAFYWDASAARLGIGVGASPAYPLDISGSRIRLKSTTGNAPLLDIESYDTGSFYIGIDNPSNTAFGFGANVRNIYSGGNYDLVISTNSAERMRIDSSGDLTIKGGRIIVRESDDGNDAVKITRDVDEGYVQLFSSGTQTIEIRGDGNTYFNGGNVGIGTTNPASKLHILGGSQYIQNDVVDSVPLRLVSNQITNGTISLQFGYDTTGYRKGAIMFQASDGAARGSLVFCTNNSVTSADATIADERMRITSVGDISFRDAGTNEAFYWDASASSLGIGTMNPADLLHIEDTQAAVSATQLTLEGRYSGYGAGIDFVSRTSNEGTRVSMAKITADGENSWTTTTSTQDAGLRFFTTQDGSQSERMRITSGGAIHLSQGTGNSYIGTNAGNLGTSTGTLNTGFGYESLYSNTTGSSNTANGYASLYFNTTGNYNTANGYSALKLNTTGYGNTAVGYISLFENTTGFRNTAVGTSALQNNTTGIYNTATGYLSLVSNTTGNYNTATGNSALYSNTTGNYNTATGNDALVYNTTGYSNTAVGAEALLDNTTGYQNTVVGTSALSNNTTGYNNTAVGLNALFTNTTGYENTAVGLYALSYNTIGNYNTGFGVYALRDITTANRCTGIGRSALISNTTGDFNTALGMSAGESNTTGSSNTFLGYNSGSNHVSGSNNTIIGNNAQASSTSVSNEFTLGNSNVSTLRCQQTSITSLSDARDKKDVETSNYGLNVIDSLRPVTFTWDNREESENKGKKDVGFIAQELQEIDDDFLRLVYAENPDKLEATYGRLIPVMVKAIQELKAEVESLKQQIS